MQKMIQFFSGIFAKELFLRFSVLATIFLYGVNLLTKLLCEQYALFIMDAIFLLCIVFLHKSYCNHNKNVQKGLLGGVLMWYLYDEVSYVLQNIVFSDSGFAAYDNVWGLGYIVLSIITLVLYAGLFLNHFIINGDHHSRPINVFLNQILVLVISAISLISMAFQMFMFSEDLAATLEAVSWHTGLVAFMLMLAAYESRFDAYRIAREAKPAR